MKVFSIMSGKWISGLQLSIPRSPCRWLCVRSARVSGPDPRYQLLPVPNSFISSFDGYSMLSEDRLLITRVSFKSKPTLGMMDELKKPSLDREYKEYVALAPAVTTPLSSPPLVVKVVPPRSKQFGAAL